MQFDDLNNAKPLFADWQHWVPFAALMVRESVPANRPMTTRIVEQSFVALLAVGGGTFATYNVMLQQQQVAQAQRDDRNDD